MATREELQKLADRINSMKPSDRLRMAAELLERGDHDTARILVNQVGGELDLLNLLGNTGKK